MNKQEFLSEFVILTSYYKADINKTVIELYFENLNQYSLEDFRRAKKEILRTRKYSNMPSIAEFIEAMEGSKDDKALKALESLERAIAVFGAYRSVAFEDRAIMRAVNSIGGWIKLCTCDESEYKWLKKDFINAYKSFSVCSNNGLTHLEGVEEISNRHLLNAPALKIYAIDYQGNTKTCLELQSQNKAICELVRLKVAR